MCAGLPPPDMVQTFYWVFTMGATEAAVNNMHACLATHTRYAIWQLETGEGGYLHYQGYCVFRTKQRLQSVKNHFTRHGMNEVHLEPRRGAHSQARDYASKAESRTGATVTTGSEDGIPEGAGQHAALSEIAQLVRQGATDFTLATEHPEAYMYHSNKIHALRQALLQPWSGPRTVIWIYGRPGCGKTRYASEHDPLLFDVPSVSAQPWFDNYTGQRSILLDNLTSSTPWQPLMKWLDRYPVQVPVKGAFVCATWSTVYVTSILHPRLFAAGYDQTTMSPAELQRRITRIYSCELDTDVEWETGLNSTSSMLRTVVDW